MKKLIPIFLTILVMCIACNSDLRKANKYKEDGDWANAEEYMKRAVAADKNNARLHNELGYIYEKRKYYELAEREYQGAVGLDANYVDAHMNRGSALFHMMRYPEAISEFEFVLKLDGNNATAMSDLALVVQLYEKNQQRAMDLYQKAISLEPNNPAFHENLARLYGEMGQSDKASDESKKAAILKAKAR